MKTPQMPSGMKTQLRYGFLFNDKETIVELNKAWFTYVKGLRELAREEAEKGEVVADENL